MEPQCGDWAGHLRNLNWRSLGMCLLTTLMLVPFSFISRHSVLTRNGVFHILRNQFYVICERPLSKLSCFVNATKFQILGRPPPLPENFTQLGIFLISPLSLLKCHTKFPDASNRVGCGGLRRVSLFTRGHLPGPVEHRQ